MDKQSWEEAVQDLSMMLMYLTRMQDSNEYCRYMETAWKGYDFGILQKLEDDQMLWQPKKSRYVYLSEKGKESARALLQKYGLPDVDLYEKFEFRKIVPDEIEQAAWIEQECFPQKEACTAQIMQQRVEQAPELFLTARDKHTGRLVGFINGLSTKEYNLRDEFFTDVSLHDPQGGNVMILGVDVLPEYRRQGIARELMYTYLRRQRENGKKLVVLTCKPQKVKMYRKMGFRDHGVSDSVWGGVQWHEMSCVVNI
ncbi:MAG: GNAT family N-acetyltransferase [Eubacterium sp.]|nr:GNAT family N-acetyltransferase [Eubacterium sp.]